MARTNVDIDDAACAEVMRRYRLATKRDAINFALRTLAAEPASVDEARALRGIGALVGRATSTQCVPTALLDTGRLISVDRVSAQHGIYRERHRS